MGFWDNFAGSFAKSAVSTASAVQGMMKNKQAMEQSAEDQSWQREDRARAETERADTKAADAAAYADYNAAALAGASGTDVRPATAGSSSPPGMMRGGIPITGAQAAPDTPTTSSQAPVTPLPPNAQAVEQSSWTPQDDETSEQRRALAVGAKPFAAAKPEPSNSGGISAPEDKGIPSALRGLAAKGNARAIANIRGIEAQNAENAKTRNNFANSASARAGNAAQTARTYQLMDADKVKAQSEKTFMSVREAAANLDTIQDDKLSVNDPAASEIVKGSLNNLSTAYSDLPDGKSAKVTYTKDGARVDFIDDKSGATINSRTVSTVGDMKKLVAGLGQTVNPENYSKLMSAVRSDELAEQMRDVRTELAKQGDANALAKTQALGEGYEFLKGAAKIPMEELLDPEKRKAIAQKLETLYQMNPEAFGVTRMIPVKDDEGNPVLDRNNQPVVKAVKGNGLMEVMAYLAPETSIKSPKGNSVELSDLMQNVISKPTFAAKFAGKTAAEVGQYLDAEMTKLGADPKVSRFYAQKYAQKYAETQSRRALGPGLPSAAAVAPQNSRFAGRGRVGVEMQPANALRLPQ